VIKTCNSVRIPAALGARKSDIDAAVNVIQAMMADCKQILKPSCVKSRRRVQTLQRPRPNDTGALSPWLLLPWAALCPSRGFCNQSTAQTSGIARR
jgi:hypothetical protein